MARDGNGKVVRNGDHVCFILEGEEKHGQVRRICGGILEVAVWHEVHQKHVRGDACTRERIHA
jgi:hypothetical protein